MTRKFSIRPARVAVIVALAIGGTAVRSARGGDCPFNWGQAIVGPEEIETAVHAMVTWDPDGDGPQQTLLVVGGQTNDGNTGWVAMWDGTTWNVLGGAMSDAVRSLAVYNGSLIAGGDFIEVDGNTVNCIVRWNGSMWESVGSGIGSTFAGRNVLALMQFGADLLVGGSFNMAGGSPISRSIAKWNGDGWQTMNTGFDLRVLAITTYNGQIVVGGGFNTTQGAGAIQLNHIALRSGTSWAPLPNGPNPGMNEAVWALTEFEGKLIAGGTFTTAGGQNANRIAQWDGKNWSSLGSGIVGDTVRALAVYDGKLVVGGVFTSVGGQDAENIALWDGVNWYPMNPNPQLDGNILSIATRNATIFASGFISTSNPNTVLLLPWGPACLPGDMNCDLDVTIDDVPLFVQALLDSPDITTCESFTANASDDVHSNGTPKLDGLDVEAFLNLLLGS